MKVLALLKKVAEKIYHYQIWCVVEAAPTACRDERAGFRTFSTMPFCRDCMKKSSHLNSVVTKFWM